MPSLHTHMAALRGVLAETEVPDCAAVRRISNLLKQLKVSGGYSVGCAYTAEYLNDWPIHLRTMAANLNPGLRAQLPGHRIGFRAAGQFDTGPVRSHNEDDFQIHPDLGLFLVIDGSGGSTSGHPTARACGWAAVEGFQHTPRHKPAGTSELEHTAGHLHRALDGAHQRVRYLIELSNRFQGSGAAIAAAHLCGNHMIMIHAGNCRVSRWRDGELIGLTEDHTLHNAFLKLKRDMSSMSGSYRNIITNGVGFSEHVRFDTSVHSVRPGDRFVLTTDGVHENLSNATMGELCATHSDPESTSELLIARAIAEKSNDNLAVVVVDICVHNDPVSEPSGGSSEPPSWIYAPNAPLSAPPVGAYKLWEALFDPNFH